MGVRKLLRLDKNIYFAGMVSLLMDISSEMVYPLLPLFLSNVLGVNKSVIGLIEGIAEATASIVRVFSGWLSDRLGNRKWLMGAGYFISTLSRPIIALASGWHMVLGSRFIDRLGKGIRTAPRDAIIADSATPEQYGRAFGLHRSMDTIGAVIGPALAFFLLARLNNDFRTVFWISMVPGLLAVLMIVFFIKEKKKAKADPNAAPPKFEWKKFDNRFKFFIVITAIFAVGNSSDAFLILRAPDLGVPVVVIPLMYMMFNGIYSFSAIPAGIAADAFGKKRLIMAGFVLFALLYFGFGAASKSWQVWVLFGFYGLFMGLTEGIQKAFLASIIPADFKATAFGIYNTAMGLALLPASMVAGYLWDKVSPSAPFYYGAATAAVSAGLFFVYSVKYEVRKL
ncbi:MAG TPA: MFS transporter [Nitrospirota bacterium]